MRRSTLPLFKQAGQTFVPSGSSKLQVGQRRGASVSSASFGSSEVSSPFATVSWYFAMTHPEKVERLVILNLPHPKCITRELANNPDQQKASQYARDFQKPDAAKKVPAAMLTFWVKEADARKIYAGEFKKDSAGSATLFSKAEKLQEGYVNPFLGAFVATQKVIVAHPRLLYDVAINSL